MKLFVLTVPGEEQSLLEELWYYFAENYLKTDRSYENLGLSETSIISISNILLGIFIGIVLASFAMVYEKRVTGAFIRKLLTSGAVGRENAVTLDALGYAKRSSIFGSLRRSSVMRKLVKCAEETDFYDELDKKRTEYEKAREEDQSLPEFKSAPYKMTKNDRFYIPCDKKSVAEKKFGAKDGSWWIIPIMIIISIIGFIALLYLIPNILELANAAVGAF